MLPKIVSLFSGAGGLDLGFRQAGFPLVFAVDSSEPAIRTHKRNFPETTSVAADLVELKPEGVLNALASVLTIGDRIGVIGGPPCQGFSRANPGALAGDPRNKLPILYLEIVEGLQRLYDVEFVLFENVLGIRDVKHELAYKGLLAKFKELGLHDSIDEYRALDFGVPQDRRRIIISAFKSPIAAKAFEPRKIPAKDLTVRSAISEYPEPAFFSRALKPESIPFHPNHWTMRPLSQRFADPENYIDGTRSFRRLAWEKPSPTVAYGNREIHVHPNGRRRLSVFEAMTLQGFPFDFILEGTLSAQVQQVSNAVPPPLARALAEATDVSLSAVTQKTKVDNDLVA